MKIRKKITLWISGAALLPTIAFSAVIFWQLMEKPFQLIDSELGHMARALSEQLDKEEPPSPSNLPYNPDAFWITVTDAEGRLIYASELTRFTDISRPGQDITYVVEKRIPRSRIWLGQDAGDDVMFRVRVIDIEHKGHPLRIRIGKPVEDLEEELISLAVHIGVSLLICILAIICISWILAGRILDPISAIIRKTRQISETSLDKRIELGKSRDELYELSVSLNAMFDRLQYSFDRQREFIGNASHELKSPLTLLRLSQEELLMHHDLPEAPANVLMKQMETTQRMSHLIKNLLDLSRMEHQERMKRQATDLVPILYKVAEDYADVLAARAIQLETQLPDSLPVTGDPERLFRLFVNLVDNAIRYNVKEEGHIALTASREKSTIKVCVTNTGDPIPDADLPRLFEQFYRVEKSRSLSLGGSGLGLAIARKITSLHAGQITVGNTPDGRVQVRVVLPCA